MRRVGFTNLGWVLGSLLALPACSGGDGDDSDGEGAGTITAPWTDFCTATFTKDVPILDPFDDPMFTARTGEQYLMANFDTVFTDLVYLASGGPDTFTIDEDPAGGYPFTSNCTIAGGVEYYAAFKDVAVYAEEALSTKICDLAEGTALPSAGGLRGFSSVGGFSLNGPATYEIYLDAFASECGGSDTGYISVPQTHSFGSDTWLVPIISIIGPN